MLSSFNVVYCHWIFLKSNFSKNLPGVPPGYIRVKQFGPRSKNVGPDLGPNCLQRLSSDDTSRHRVNRNDKMFDQKKY